MNTSFERCELTKVEWLTPPELVKKLGEFDLDPCSPINAPFLHAKTNYTIENDGLGKEWFGRVYCNPPYGKQMYLWLEKLKNHGNGIALIFARTETKCFLRTSGIPPMHFFSSKAESASITSPAFKAERPAHRASLSRMEKKTLLL